MPNVQGSERAEQAEQVQEVEHVQVQAPPAPPAPPAEPGRVIVNRNGKTISIENGQVTVRTEPGTMVPPPYRDAPVIPSQAVDIAMGFFTMVTLVAIGTPLARAFGRRMDRKTLAPPTQSPDESARLARIENALEAVAVEVERIGEGQRYVTQVMASRGEPMAQLAEGGKRAS
jgi:hypothetical protein